MHVCAQTQAHTFAFIACHRPYSFRPWDTELKLWIFDNLVTGDNDLLVMHVMHVVYALHEVYVWVVLLLTCNADSWSTLVSHSQCQNCRHLATPLRLILCGAHTQTCMHTHARARHKYICDAHTHNTHTLHTNTLPTNTHATQYTHIHTHTRNTRFLSGIT